MSNLLSGFVGALIVVLFTELIKFWQTKLKILKDRKTLVNYIKEVIKPGIQTYILDLDHASDEIRAYPHKSPTIRNYNYDALPSLNSEILKGLDFKELLYLVRDIDNHKQIIDVYHCIDYLKEQMGFHYVEAYQTYARDHFEKKGIEESAAQAQHTNTCSGMKQAKDTLIRRIEAKKRTATQVQLIIDNLLSSI